MRLKNIRNANLTILSIKNLGKDSCFFLFVLRDRLNN